MNAHELLTLARAKIASPDAWTQGAYARDKHKIEVWQGSVDACQFCMLGALRAVSRSLWTWSSPAPKEYLQASRALTDAIEERLDLKKGTDVSTTIIYFNDSATHDEVLAVYDRAIQATANRKE